MIQKDDKHPMLEPAPARFSDTYASTKNNHPAEMLLDPAINAHAFTWA